MAGMPGELLAIENYGKVEASPIQPFFPGNLLR